MATKRSDLIDSESAGFYHLISRCVRRAFLCGEDVETGRSYEHRRTWIEDRILSLAKYFSIEVYSYAVMSNHYHLVVFVDPKLPWQWSDAEVVERWLKIFPFKSDNQVRLDARKTLLLADKERLEIIRQRLGNLSWLMRCINEPIAKQSNAEDFCKGHFWESRFHSQALLDEAAALTCMAYVDLNPIRAGLVKTPEESEFTGIQHRLIHMTQAQLDQAVEAIAGKVRQRPLNLTLQEYIELVDWTGKTMVHPHKSAIPTHLAPIMQRLNLNSNQWLNHVKGYGNHFYRAIGSLEKIKDWVAQKNQHWIKGINAIKAIYLT